jgi:hypothetical protein
MDDVFILPGILDMMYDLSGGLRDTLRKFMRKQLKSLRDLDSCKLFYGIG